VAAKSYTSNGVGVGRPQNANTLHMHTAKQCLKSKTHLTDTYLYCFEISLLVTETYYKLYTFTFGWMEEIIGVYKFLV
jgi:hypothetical protein